MDQILEAMQYDWAIRALIASIVVGIICGILGCFIVLRNMSLVGDALSHAVLPGVVVSFIIFGYNTFGFFLGSVAAGLLTAVIIIWIQQNVKTKNDAAIGIVFTAMFSIGVIGISKISKEGGVHLDLKDFLFGNILGVGPNDIYLSLTIGLVIVLTIFLFYRHLFVSTFQPVVARTMGFNVDLLHYFLMLLLSFAVVASLQTVGVILVVAMLITPAATALLLSNHLKIVLLISALIGVISSVLGILLAICFNTTPGPVITLVATLFYIIAVFFSPEKGLLFKSLQKRKRQFNIFKEDFLKESYKLVEKGLFSEQSLRQRLNWTSHRFRYIHSVLQRKGMVKRQLDPNPLTPVGEKAASRMVRAHRLWETYLVNKMNMNEDQIHEEAEKLEHHLTDELLNELDQSLGSPKLDPHGSEIPSAVITEHRINAQNLQVGQKFTLSSSNVEQKLRNAEKFQLAPGDSYYVKRKSNSYWHIKREDQTEFIIPKNIFRNLKVEV